MDKSLAQAIKSGLYLRLSAKGAVHTANERGQRTDCGIALNAEARDLVPTMAEGLPMLREVCRRCATRHGELFIALKMG